MLIRRSLIGSGFGIATFALVGAMPTSDAQQAFKRTVLQKADLTDLDQREGVIITAEIPPGVETGRHTHPGTELAYLLEGSIVLEVEGLPAKTYKAGETWIIEPGKVHNAKGTSDTTARTLVVYVAEKGKPLASPAP
jgi:quercetin dioxygenase-like cupin family protein